VKLKSQHGRRRTLRMGQCKSKVADLPGVDNQDGAVLKARKSNKRKWRKSKGYSLSASLEGDLHCNEEERAVNPKKWPRAGFLQRDRPGEQAGVHGTSELFPF
jgi:hypothetical protein